MYAFPSEELKNWRQEIAMLHPWGSVFWYCKKGWINLLSREWNVVPRGKRGGGGGSGWHGNTSCVTQWHPFLGGSNWAASSVLLVNQLNPAVGLFNLLCVVLCIVSTVPLFLQAFHHSQPFQYTTVYKDFRSLSLILLAEVLRWNHRHLSIKTQVSILFTWDQQEMHVCCKRCVYCLKMAIKRLISICILF